MTSETQAAEKPSDIDRIADAIKNANRRRPIEPGTSFYNAQDRAYRIMAEAAMAEMAAILMEPGTGSLNDRVVSAIAAEVEAYGALDPAPELLQQKLRLIAGLAIQQVRAHDAAQAIAQEPESVEETPRVISLHGGPTPEELAHPDPVVVEATAKLYEEAQSGRLRALGYVALDREDTTFAADLVGTKLKWSTAIFAATGLVDDLMHQYRRWRAMREGGN